MSEHDSPNHTRRGKFAPGNNAWAEARARRQKNGAIRVGNATDKGKGIVDGMLEIARDPTHRDRYKALDWLWKLYAGKEVERLEVTGPGGAHLNPLHSFTPEQLLAFAQGRMKLEEPEKP